ncbi:MAG: prolipoprotein diacylglyceryl transferase [Flavobacteriales bacterium]
MYPQLYHFFYDQFGWDLPFMRAINSFGFFVAIAFIAAAYVFSRELKRKYSQGFIPAIKKNTWVGKPASVTELAINALIGILIGYKLSYAIFNNDVFQDFPTFLLSSKGNWIGALVLGAFLAGWKYYEANKTKLVTPVLKEVDFLPQQHTGPLLTIAAVFGIIGAKLFAYLEDPGDFIKFIYDPFSGLTMYGGLICALLAGYVYMRKFNLPPMQFMDAVAPAVMLAYGIGRIGCHVSGDGDWGIANLNPNPGWLPDWLWAYDYPNNVNNEDTPLGECYYGDKYCSHLAVPVYPTALYEALMCSFLFGVMWLVRKRYIIAGLMFSTYLMLNGVERFLIEKIRVNKTYVIFGNEITQAEIISFSFILVGLVGIIYLLRRHKKGIKNTAPPTAET